MTDGDGDWTRRGILATATAALLAGCQSDGGGTEMSPSTTRAGTTVATTATTTESTETTTGTATEPAYRVDRDLSFVETDAGPLRLDLYRPRDRTDVPFVVFAHGGGWLQGDKGFRPLFPMLCEAGIAVADVQYRLAPGAQFPVPVRDVVAAVTWVRANAAEYGIDPVRGALAGYSAGAHLAALVAVAPDVPAFRPDVRPDQPVAVDALVGFSGIYDLADSESMESALVQTFVGSEEPESTYERASPVSHTDADDPPALLLHGTEDGVVPYRSATRLRDSLRAASVPVELFTAEGAGHGLIDAPSWQSEYEPALRRFLRDRLAVAD
ncbi:alpha/beta hydrolase [Haloarchaeobius iranensis]|uniref:Acetyl esterase/lipase n=1 Tax=Haloarchaeobius iranensis TaxID=996166 RepID=A0A1G9VBF5_9EURY|nr:alpha/beta hydrolase [Haloarchaeobius iranensis]SDM69532.1 Acetyl esterase/lipase [Haloarchaeobius iranensis]